MKKLCTWLFKFWREVKSHTYMIIKGWGKCGLQRSFKKDFPVKATDSSSFLWISFTVA